MMRHAQNRSPLWGAIGFVICVALGVLLGLAAAGPAHAARVTYNPNAPTFTLDAAGFRTAGDVAAAWTATGYVNVVPGSCAQSDPYCIKAVVGPDGSDRSHAYSGTGACAVDIAREAMSYGKGKNRYDSQFNALAHEAGHCILRSDWHASDPYDLMYFMQNLGVPRKAILAETLSQLAATVYP